MSDRIEITSIKAFGFHGVFEHEAREGQEFLVDVAMSVDLQRASATDALEDTVDYGAITDLVVNEIKGERVALIEKLAGRIAENILSSQNKVENVAVTVHKPHAPVSASVTDISVTVHRKR